MGKTAFGPNRQGNNGAPDEWVVIPPEEDFEWENEEEENGEENGEEMPFGNNYDWGQ